MTARGTRARDCHHRGQPRAFGSTPSAPLLPGSSLTSKLDEATRAKLIAAGVDLVGERLGIQCGIDEARNKYPVLTPDLTVADSQVCVEIDRITSTPTGWSRTRRTSGLLADAGLRPVEPASQCGDCFLGRALLHDELLPVIHEKA
ncbi:hypothetical protein [Arthrobacter sp. OY3WO11]|uniref:hypothetical protein n=1 Tax=Arthrobacter sp. OY3WO11 TaxID=1835723 RepID=UPI0007CF8F30|nr:hypothetical protein [Arthrobacter sp. OY3WO11]OAE01764.1 hypothetical protein A6A22_10315 [Arthrobacter sp. OY3WO11]